MEFTLRAWKGNDVDALVRHANNPNIAKFLTDQFPHPYTAKDGEEFILRATREHPRKMLAIDVSGEAVGSIGVFPQTDIHSMNAEMGYWLSEEYWGNGIMTRAVRQMVKYGFETFEINRIYARPFGTNTASHRVLEKAGFVLEARFKETILKNGETLDELVYAIRKHSERSY